MTAVTTPQQPSKSEITTVLYGEEAVNNTILKFIEDATQGWDTYIDKTGLSIALTVEPIRKARKWYDELKEERIRDIQTETLE